MDNVLGVDGSTTDIFSSDEQSDWAFLAPRLTLFSRDALLRAVVPLAYQVPGSIVEFGVAKGNSTRVIQSTARKMERYYGAEHKKRIYACDSFEGLPEKYENAEVGAFACNPPDIKGVQIVKGYFEESLTDELAAEVGTVALASLDADLYSSTLCALGWLTPLLRTGSLLLFDEFLGENESEKKAFEKWSEDSGIKTVLLGYFARNPSAWGSKMDARVLYQVVGKEELVRPVARWDLKRRGSRLLDHIRNYAKP